MHYLSRVYTVCRSSNSSNSEMALFKFKDKYNNGLMFDIPLVAVRCGACFHFCPIRSQIVVLSVSCLAW